MTQTKYIPSSGLIQIQEGTKIAIPGGPPPTPPVQTNFFQYQGLDPGPFAPLPFPDTAIPFTGDFIAGMAFTVINVSWFMGYWYYLCPNGGVQQTQKFALWAANGVNVGEIIEGSVITSGPLFVGWNFIAIPTPIQLGVGVVYVAATGVNGNFTDLQNVFGVGEPLANGVFSANQTAFTYSDLTGGLGGSPYVNQGLFSTAGNDPSLTMPIQQSNSSWFGMDVQLADGPPLGYKGTFRMFTDPANSLAYQISPDNAVNYIVGTFTGAFRAVTVKRIWYYSPAGTVQLATSADIWLYTGNPDDVNVYHDGSPAWSGPAGSGWVSVEVPNVKLKVFTNYAVTVYNGDPVPDEWSAKSVFFWGGEGTGQIDFTNGNNIGNNSFFGGGIIMPTTNAALQCWRYNGNAGGVPPFSDGTQIQGQCVFAVGPPNQSPYLYVDSLFQNYYVEMEVE